MKFSNLLPALLLLTTVGINASAQKFSFSNTPVVDATGKPVAVSKYMHVKGSPFIFDEWLPGEVVTEDGELHTGMLLKYNIETNLPSYTARRKNP